MKLINFFKDTVEESKKLQLPSKKETNTPTITIIITIIIVSLGILFADFIISKFIGLIFGL